MDDSQSASPNHYSALIQENHPPLSNDKKRRNLPKSFIKLLKRLKLKRLIICSVLLLALLAAALYAIFNDNEFRLYFFYPLLVVVGGYILVSVVTQLMREFKADDEEHDH